MNEIIKLIVYLVFGAVIGYILFRKWNKLDRAKPTMPKSLKEMFTYDFIIDVIYLGEKTGNKEVLYLARYTDCTSVKEFINSRTYKDFKNNQLEEEKILGYKVASLSVRRTISKEYIMETPAIMLNGKLEYTYKDLENGQEYIGII